AAQGLFRPDVAARDLYLLIASTGYFYTSNRHTLSAFLGEPLETPEAVAHWEGFVIETVLRTVEARAPEEETSPPPEAPMNAPVPAPTAARSPVPRRSQAALRPVRREA